MSRSFLQLAAVTALTFAAARTQAASAADDALAARFYPPGLVQEIDNPEELLQSWDLTRADLSGTGSEDFLVVAYSNGLHDLVRVLQVQNGNAIVVADPELPTLGPARATIERCEVDGDAAPEFMLRLRGDRSTEDYVLDWTGQTLRIISPTTVTALGRTETLISSTRLADLDGDGRVELLVRHTDPGSTPVDVVYRFNGGKFVQESDVVFQQRLVRDQGEANSIDARFTAKPGRYLVRVVNGDRLGDNRATSAELLINDTTVFAESAFKKRDRLLSAYVTLGESNTILFDVRSAPGSVVSISIAKAP
ncbi:MAG: hypothetical protein M3Q69_00010 [Acidobacteriota bacterium]|nr:hypothetical protein [Acidobacteriota bacterium]